MTKSFNYNEAIKDIERSKMVSREEVIKMLTDTSNEYEQGTIAYNDKETLIEHTIGNKHGLYMNEAIQAQEGIKATGAYPYLDVVAIELLKMLDVADTHQTRSRARHICYYTNKYQRAIHVVEKYHNMLKEGYISLNDITEDMNGKKALLTGKGEIDWFTIQKDNEPVTIVYTDTARGYKKKGQRSRYYQTPIDGDYFIKLIK